MSEQRPPLSTAVLTGASRGIGPSIARALAEEGFRLAIAARSADLLETVAADLRSAGHDVIAIPTDVTNRGDLERLVDRAETELGGVDVLVNNAGGDPFRQFHNYRAEDVDDVFGLNVLGPIELTRLLLPRMLARGRGHVVNVSSFAGRMGFPYTEVYAAAKDGLIGFTRVLRADYRALGVSASVVVLGPIRDAGQSARTTEETGVEVPRAGLMFTKKPQDVARAVVDSITHDRAEIVVMPGAGRLMKAALDYFPTLGTRLNGMTGTNDVMRRVVEAHESRAGHVPG
jgi:short-subunit dehydrogenase